MATCTLMNCFRRVGAIRITRLTRPSKWKELFRKLEVIVLMRYLLFTDIFIRSEWIASLTANKMAFCNGAYFLVNESDLFRIRCCCKCMSIIVDEITSLFNTFHFQCTSTTIDVMLFWATIALLISLPVNFTELQDLTMTIVSMWNFYEGNFAEFLCLPVVFSRRHFL